MSALFEARTLLYAIGTGAAVAGLWLMGSTVWVAWRERGRS